MIDYLILILLIIVIVILFWLGHNYATINITEQWQEEMADFHPHWISVEEEKLPKLGQMVLAFKPDDTFQFTTTFFTTIDVWKKLGITHWMPMPEAPKKGE